MPRRCPPGVICLENVTIIFIIIVFLVIGFILYRRSSHIVQNMPAYNHMSMTMPMTMPINEIMGGCANNNKGRGDDVFFDIYKAPLRDDRYMTGGALDIRGNVPITARPILSTPLYGPVTHGPVTHGPVRQIPINVSTQGTDFADYRQVGILTSGETILPLMGRPLFSRRDKWNFYTLNDKNNMIKLPVKVGGKSGTSEYGCDNVTTGDRVYVEGYNVVFKVTAYDNQVMQYLPF